MARFDVGRECGERTSGASGGPSGEMAAPRLDVRREYNLAAEAAVPEFTGSAQVAGIIERRKFGEERPEAGEMAELDERQEQTGRKGRTRKRRGRCHRVAGNRNRW